MQDLLSGILSLIGQPISLALAGLESALRLIDDIDAALASHDAIVAMAAAQRFQ
jgi:hypothetical protein